MKCFNRNVLIGLAIVGAALFFVVPSARGALPLLLFAACPLSMILMMGGMAMGSKKNSCAPGQAPVDAAIAAKDAEITRLNTLLLEGRAADTGLPHPTSPVSPGPGQR